MKSNNYKWKYTEENAARIVIFRTGARLVLEDQEILSSSLMSHSTVRLV